MGMSGRRGAAVPGDILAIYIDGITEVSNRNEEEFGEERLISLSRRSKGLGPSDSLHQISNRFKSSTQVSRPTI